MSFYRILPQKQRIVIVNYTSRNQKDVLILLIYYIIIFLQLYIDIFQPPVSSHNNIK